MGYNKIVYDNNTLIDLTNDTVTADKMIQGTTAHDKAGNLIVGTAVADPTLIQTMQELQERWNEGYVLVYYDNADTGITYVTDTVTVSKGILVETDNITSASKWYLEQVSGYQDRFYIYCIKNGVNQYIYNYTSGGANFINLSTTEKQVFIFSQQEEGKFYVKCANANKWLQHSKSGGGIRLYTDANNANNCQFFLLTGKNAVVPYGTLVITEPGTYDVYNYKTVIVNI